MAQLTTDIVTRLVDVRPFRRFEMITVDGRTIRVPHSDYVTIERHALSTIVYHDNGRQEFFDMALIVSILTLDTES